MVNTIAYLKDIYNKGDYVVPRVHVTNKVEVKTTEPGRAGTVAVVGAFPTGCTQIKSFSSYKSMLASFGLEEGDGAIEHFNGLKACRYMFHDSNSAITGATEILIVNISEETEKGRSNAKGLGYDPDEGTWYGYVGNDVQDAKTEIKTIKATQDNTGDGQVTADDDLVWHYDYSDDDLYDTKLTFAKLRGALNRLYGEIFDLLFVADTFEDIANDKTLKIEGSEEGTTITPADAQERRRLAYQECDNFLGSEFQMQRPSQLVAPLLTDVPQASSTTNGGVVSSSKAYNQSTTINIDQAKDICNIFRTSVFNYGELIAQRIYIHYGTQPLSLVESAAYICGFMAGLNVGTPLTFRTIPGVTGVTEELSVGSVDPGYALAKAGIGVIVNKIRNTQEYCVLNSTSPSGYDVAQIRAVAYLIRQYDLQQYLGMPNNESTRANLAADLQIVNQRVLGEIPIIESIDTSNISVPTDDSGAPIPEEVYIELHVVVHGVLIVIDLGVVMEKGDK